MKLKTITEVEKLRGMRVLIRADLNVPLVDRHITDDYRLRRLLPTLLFLKEAGAHIILIGHIENEDYDSLQPVAEYLNQHLTTSFIGDLDFFSLEGKLAGLGEGECAVLENLRRNRGEESNDETFARNLATLGDIFVNEAFSVSHRAHASVVGIPKFLPSVVGPLFAEEVSQLSAAFNPRHPFLFILGGSKFSTKLPLLEKFLDRADTVFVGGALAQDVFRARGLSVGMSLVSDYVIPEHVLAHPHLLTPFTVSVRNGVGVVRECAPEDVRSDEAIVDCGREAIRTITDDIERAALIVWNGPLGIYEKGDTEATNQLAQAIARSSAHSIAGGGDTAAALRHAQADQKLTFLSTGGGAMLQFLADETLLGIEALMPAQSRD